MKALSVVAALCASAATLAAQGAPQSTMVDAGGHKLHVQVTGTARPGVPTVVFEMGLGSTLPTWLGVPAEIAASTRVVAYERAGIGESEAAAEPRTVKQIVAELHALLAKIDVPPPYVLVGHSYGGPLIHSFAATYPKEVAGLVYDDPMDFTQTEADMEAIWVKLGIQDGRDAMRKGMAQLLPSMPVGAQAEAREIERMERAGFADFRAAGEPPEVPTVILLAGKSQPLPPAVAFPVGYEKYFQTLLEQRRGHFGQLAEHAARGTLVETSKSSHFIHMTEPDLLVWSIQRVLSSAAAHPELSRFEGEYPLTLAPNIIITITRDGDKLSGQLTGQPPFTLYADSATKFSLKVVAAQIEFEIDAAGAVTGLVLAQNGQRLRALKTK